MVQLLASLVNSISGPALVAEAETRGLREKEIWIRILILLPAVYEILDKTVNPIEPVF